MSLLLLFQPAAAGPPAPPISAAVRHGMNGAPLTLVGSGPFTITDPIDAELAAGFYWRSPADGVTKKLFTRAGNVFTINQ